MLTMKARYAIRALTALAQASLDEPLLTGDIARSEGIPLRFLEAILYELRQRGFLYSRKGRGGGYFLSLPADQITVEAIVTAMDGPLVPDPCIGSRNQHLCRECQTQEECAVRFVLDRVSSSVAEALRGLTIAELAARVPRREHDAGTRTSFAQLGSHALIPVMAI